MGLSVSAYANHRGCSRQAVYKAIRAGQIVQADDGTIDPYLADKAWPQRVAVKGAPAAGPTPPGAVRQPSREPATVDDLDMSDPDILSLAKTIDGEAVPHQTISRARYEFARAKLTELDLQEQRQQLVRVADMQREQFQRARALRNSLLDIPAAIAGRIAGLTDPKAVEHAIRAALVQALTQHVEADGE